MADRDTDSGQEPSLELPSFGLRRRKKRAAADPASEQSDAGGSTESTPTEPTPTEPTPTEPTPTEPTPTEPTKTAPPREQPTPVAPATEPRDAEPTEVLAPAETTTLAPPPAAEGQEPGARRRRREARLPAMAGPVGAVVAGVVVGLLAVGLTFGALQACETVRGTSSCGGGPGFFLLLAVLVLLTYVGSWLLAAAGVRDPGSTSFLAVGLLAVVAMLFLIEVLMSPWMALVIPLVAAATFTLSYQVTTAIVEEE